MNCVLFLKLAAEWRQRFGVGMATSRVQVG
jgi:hypothetical protein